MDWMLWTRPASTVPNTSTCRHFHFLSIVSSSWSHFRSAAAAVDRQIERDGRSFICLAQVAVNPATRTEITVTAVTQEHSHNGNWLSAFQFHFSSSSPLGLLFLRTTHRLTALSQTDTNCSGQEARISRRRRTGSFGTVEPLTHSPSLDQLLGDEETHENRG